MKTCIKCGRTDSSSRWYKGPTCYFCYDEAQPEATKVRQKEYQKDYYRKNAEELKEYAKTYGKTYRKENAEEIKEYNKKYEEEHVDERKAYQKEYSKENAEEIKEKRKVRYQTHIEETKEYSKQYKKEHPELYKKAPRTDKARLNRCRQGAKKRNLEFTLTLEQWQQLVVGQNCHYCDGALPETGGALDRKDNSKGYIFENCVPCCAACNTMKGAHLTYDEMVLIWTLRKKAKA